MEKSKIDFPEKPFYSLDETADLLGVHRNTVKNHIKAGKIKAGKVGQQWRIPRESILELFEPRSL